MKPLLLWCLLLCATVIASAQTPKVKTSDFEVLTGAPFTGTITYHNHLLGTTETVPVKLKVTPSAKDKNAWDFTYEFPDNPNENETETIVLVSGGRFLNNQEVAERQQQANGLLRIITEETQTKGPGTSLLVHRYLFGKNTFSIKTVEQVRDEDTFRPEQTIELKR